MSTYYDDSKYETAEVPAVPDGDTDSDSDSGYDSEYLGALGISSRDDDDDDAVYVDEAAADTWKLNADEREQLAAAVAKREADKYAQLVKEAAAQYERRGEFDLEPIKDYALRKAEGAAAAIVNAPDLSTKWTNIKNLADSGKKGVINSTVRSLKRQLTSLGEAEQELAQRKRDKAWVKTKISIHKKKSESELPDSKGKLGWGKRWGFPLPKGLSPFHMKEEIPLYYNLIDYSWVRVGNEELLPINVRPDIEGNREIPEVEDIEKLEEYWGPGSKAKKNLYRFVKKMWEAEKRRQQRWREREDIPAWAYFAEDEKYEEDKKNEEDEEDEIMPNDFPADDLNRLPIYTKDGEICKKCCRERHIGTKWLSGKPKYSYGCFDAGEKWQECRKERDQLKTGDFLLLKEKEGKFFPRKIQNWNPETCEYTVIDSTTNKPQTISNENLKNSMPLESWIGKRVRDADGNQGKIVSWNANNEIFNVAWKRKELNLKYPQKLPFLKPQFLKLERPTKSFYDSADEQQLWL